MNKKNTLSYIFIYLFAVFPQTLQSQEIVPAIDFFNIVSDRYGQISDYTGEIVITKGEDILEGVIYYKTPDRLRINFTVPKDQVIVVSNEKLTIYLPQQSAVMVQQLKKQNPSSLAAMAGSQGLHMLSKGYSISYLNNPDLVSLDDGSNEKVVKLKLEWRTTDEGFRQIYMSIGKDGLIRRMKGINAEYEELQIDFKNIKINQNISDARFDYELPASAYIIKNFLFEPED